MPIVRTLRKPAVVAAVAVLLGSPVWAEGGKQPEAQKPKALDKPVV
jgi:hypothetical protein